MSDEAFFRWTASEDGRVVDVDEGWATFVGRPGESTLGNGWRSLFSAEDAARLAAAGAQAREEHGMFVLEAMVKREAGVQSPVVICGVPVESNGRNVGFHGVTVPIHPVVPPQVVASCVRCGDVEGGDGVWVSIADAVLARWRLEAAVCPRCLRTAPPAD